MQVEIKIENWVRELLLEIKGNMKGYDVYLGGGCGTISKGATYVKIWQLIYMILD